MEKGIRIVHPNHGARIVGHGLVRVYLPDLHNGLPRASAENTETGVEPPPEPEQKSKEPPVVTDGTQKKPVKGKAKSGGVVEEITDGQFDAGEGDASIVEDIDLDELAAQLAAE